MAYKKFQANQLFTGKTLLDSSCVLITDEHGVIQDIVPEKEAGSDVQQLEGILSPGLFNCHCHLELSHMKGHIPPGGGLTSFIAAVMQTPPASFEEREIHMRQADTEMYNNGIVAVGDISNNTTSIQTKSKSRICWYNFLEVTNLDDHKAEEKMKDFLTMEAACNETIPPPVQSAIVPHASYSVSPATFRLINEYTQGKTITIHNQESAGEDELFTNGTGPFLSFYRGIGRSSLPIAVSGKSSLQTWLPYFTKEQTILLVHNTCTREEDIIYANGYAKNNGLTLYYCLCPHANLYIENRLPPVDLLLKHECNIVLGTDSYGSNHQLSMAGEMSVLLQHFPSLSPAQVLQWTTSNSSAALQLQHEKGSFEKGKKPGVVLIQNDFSASKRLV
ncbi:MAG: amidohydrolase family protein [Chitinophagaceae bacterium]|nr:amidohydrolase family protein [Chitinophagaceae bacterium]